MDRGPRDYLFRLAMACVLALVAAVGHAQPPNIVMILADDVGYGDLASYGHPYARTPSLDKLARQGTRFTQFYVTGNTCNPSRTGFMTGRYPATFFQRTDLNGFGDAVTITELLARRGYRTGHFGKWHIGPIEKDGTYGIYNVNTVSGRRKKRDGRDAALFSAAIKFIEKNRDGPFYVNIWGHIAHSPIDPPASMHESFPPFAFDRNDFGSWAQENFDKSQFLIDKYNLQDDLATAMRKYLSEIRALDAQVGRLLDKLDELGLRKRTIVVFASDQGAEPVFIGQRGLTDEIAHPDRAKNLLGFAGGLRGSKHTIYEGGVRSPLIIRWPKRVPRSVVNETSVISATDWLPTLCSIVGIELDSTAEKLDGKDISDIWFGARRSRTKPIFWRNPSATSAPTMRSGKWKITQFGPSYELYDIAEDPFEMNDLGSSRQDVINQLSPEIARWEETLPTTYVARRVESPRRPKARAGRDRVVKDANGDGRVWVKLDASGSTDPDGFISGYVWKLNGRKLAVSRNPFVELPLGEHTITLKVTDYSNQKSRDKLKISVVR